MIRRHGRFLRLSLVGADGIAATVLMALLSSLRFGPDWPGLWAGLLPAWPTVALLMAVAWSGVLWSRGLYSLRSHWSFGSQARSISQATVIMALATFAALFLLKVPDVSRLFLLLLFPCLALSALLSRAAIHALLSWLRLRGGNSRFVLIVGSGQTAVRFGREIESHPTLGLKIVGYVNGEPEPGMAWPFLGQLSELPEVLHLQVVDEVAVCLDLANWESMQQIADVCRAEGKIIRLPLAGAIFGATGTHVEDLGGLPVLSIVQGPDRQAALAAKRIVDVVAAGLGLLVLSPLLAGLALAVWLIDGRPVFFAQERVGVHGRRFKLLKLRTMVQDAEERLQEVRGLNEVEGPAFKASHDPRITPLGRLLRSTSLDELPQLWNVLRGEMSMVGPRPPLPSEVSEYDPWHRRRLSMKPGVTGLWQVGHRRDPKFDRWVERDLEYIDRWSLRLDVQIALRTIPRMLRAEGR
ncbi:MAG TPA: sugar transferase [Candidatus Limnocylindria bacterium]|nr:sugar transferase [Candidatus Limnocylindria bacterium]